jgi:hypothetical protein
MFPTRPIIERSFGDVKPLVRYLRPGRQAWVARASRAAFAVHCAPRRRVLVDD